jgi:alcohol dehydrogenase class IV
MSSKTVRFPIGRFLGPASVIAGHGAIGSVARELATAGVRPSGGDVLLVADAAVLELGLAQPVVAALRHAGFQVDQRPGVTGEPTPATISGLLPSDPERSVAGVLAIGGGSTLDAAKLVATATCNELTLSAGLSPTTDLAPSPVVIAAPTTAGTGAEATAVAMLWHEGAKRMFVHPQLVPRIAILDPNLLADLPAPVTAAGGLDAISHAVESLLSTFRTPLTEAAAWTALGHLAPSVLAAYRTGAPAARMSTLLGAYQAGLALNASVVLGHSLAYVVAGQAGLPHGVTCAMALPYCLAHCRSERLDAIEDAAEIVTGERRAARLLEWLVAANQELGIPASLQDAGIDAAMLPAMAAECVERYPRPNHPTPLDVEDIERLLQHFHRGDAFGAWHDPSFDRPSGASR